MPVLDRLSRTAARASGWCSKHSGIINTVFGIFWTASALFVVVISIIVFAQQEERDREHKREAKTVRTACVRSKVFGPPFLAFLEQTEGKLGIEPLNVRLKIEGKETSVLDFYRSTIPRSCPD